MPISKQKSRKVGGPGFYSKSLNQFGQLQQTANETAKEYIGTILYPGSIQGVKIPDFNMYPTVTAHTEQEGTFSCSAAGNGGMLVRLHAGTGSAPTSGGGGSITIQDPATTTDLAFTYLAASNIRSNPAAFSGSYKFARLVSASLEVQYVGNDNNNQGRIVQGILVKDEYLFASFSSFNSILNSRDNLCCSVTGGAYMRYRPVDESSFDFVDIASTSATENQGVFIVAVNACGAGAPFRWKLSCNWECIIRSDAFDQPIANMAEIGNSNPQAFDASKASLKQVTAANMLKDSTISKNDNNPVAAKKEASTLLGYLGNQAYDFANAIGQGAGKDFHLVARQYLDAPSFGGKLGSFYSMTNKGGLQSLGASIPSAPKGQRVFRGGGRAVARQPMMTMEPYGRIVNIAPEAASASRVGRLYVPPPKFVPPPWK